MPIAFAFFDYFHAAIFFIFAADYAAALPHAASPPLMMMLMMMPLPLMLLLLYFDADALPLFRYYACRLPLYTHTPHVSPPIFFRYALFIF